MKLGGWSNPGTMRKIYTHLADQDLRRDADKLLSFFQSPPGAKNDGGNEDENNVQNDNENDNAEK